MTKNILKDNKGNRYRIEGPYDLLPIALQRGNEVEGR
jgi:hypothetical protein